MTRLSTLMAVVLLIGSNSVVRSQSGYKDNLHLPPSPNAAIMSRFVSVPVSHATGVANVSVPLVSLQGKAGIQVPVVLNYHASGVKVQDVASSYGLGWNLSAGGMITRVVRGKPDGSVGICNPAEFSYIVSGGCDPEADLFYYSFLGRGGQMFLSSTGLPATMPYQDLKIYPGVGAQSIGHWSITDEAGFEYIFGDAASNREESVSYFQSNASTYTEKDTYISTWYLSKIKSPQGEQVVEFLYDEGDDINIYMYAQKRLDVVKSSNCSNSNPEGTTLYANSRVMTKSAKYLDRIVTSLGSIKFNYSTTRSDLTGGRSLSSMSMTNHLGADVKKFFFEYSYFTHHFAFTDVHLKLDKIREDFLMNSVAAFEFTYDTPNGMAFRNSLSTDLWGYFNYSNEINADYKFPNVNENCPSSPWCSGGLNKSKYFPAMVRGTLTEIKYATGGTKKFTYQEKGAGGLRVHTITDLIGTTEIAKSTFTYSNEWILRAPVLFYKYTVTGSVGFIGSLFGNEACSKTYMVRSRDSFTALFDLDGTAAGYANVTETKLDGSKVEMTFTSKTDFGDAAPVVKKCTGEYDISTSCSIISEVNGPPFSANTSRFWMRGLPKKVIIYDSENNKLSETTNFYTSIGPLMTSRSSIPTEQNSREGNNLVYHRGEYSLESCPVQMTSYTTNIYPQGGGSNPIFSVQTTGTFTYHSTHSTRLASAVASIGNAGFATKVTYRYPSDLYVGSPPALAEQRADGIWRLRGNNVIIPVETVNWYKEPGGSYMITNAILRTFKRNLAVRPIPYETFVLNVVPGMTALTPEASLTSSGTVFTYDDDNYRLVSTDYHNSTTSLLETSTYSDGTSVDYSWDGTGSLLNTISGKGNASTAFTTTYSYKPLVGITNIADENGINTKFEYDVHGRLKLVRDHDNMITSRTRYHYKNANESQIDFVIGGSTTETYPTTFTSTIDMESIGTTRYVWDYGDGQVSEGTSSSTTHAYAGPGTYTVKLSKINPEYGTLHTTKSVTITPILQGVATASGNWNRCVPEFPPKVQVTHSGGCGSRSVVWEKRVGSSWVHLGFGDQYVFTYEGWGTYEVRAVITDACQAQVITETLTVTLTMVDCN